MTDNKQGFTSTQFQSFAQRCRLTLHRPEAQYFIRTGWKGTFAINKISSLLKRRI